MKKKENPRDEEKKLGAKKKKVLLAGLTRFARF